MIFSQNIGGKAMGALVHDPNVPQAQTVLNSRFAPGDPLKEMIAIQKEFDVFSLKHSLASASSLLNIAPPEAKDRRGWFKFCDHLKKLPSDKNGMTAHDRVITAVRDNLASAHPLPMYFTWHPGVRLEVSKGQALSFSKTEYVIVSAPVGHAPG
jgi:hypothetical protein